MKEEFENMVSKMKAQEEEKIALLVRQQQEL